MIKRPDRIRMPAIVQFRKALIFGMVAAFCPALGLSAVADPATLPDPTINTALDRGYLGLYNLDFIGAQKDFSTWERQHPRTPSARILLAIAYVRDKNKPRALELLSSLRTDFPGNTLFAREIIRLQSVH